MLKYDEERLSEYDDAEYMSHCPTCDELTPSKAYTLETKNDAVECCVCGCISE